jgi:lipoprotein-anchoring transpeptidase ErfK/SrfK
VPRPAPLPPGQVAFAVLKEAGRLVDGKSVRVYVSLDAQRLTVTHNGTLVAWSDVTTGAAHSPTPQGLLTVQRKEEAYRSALFDVEMPHALFLTQDGIAIHGGRLHVAPASAGCIRVPYAFARWLYRHVQVGTEILIS